MGSGEVVGLRNGESVFGGVQVAALLESFLFLVLFFSFFSTAIHGGNLVFCLCD